LEALHRVLKTCARAANQYFLNIRGIPHGDEDFHDAIILAIKKKDFHATMTMLKEDIKEII
ncbi:MAG: hypothetical protein GX786_03370, partial [Clostridiales bacterium]|nr:hypothetical protein [Clostridiales bacterium]